MLSELAHQVSEVAEYVPGKHLAVADALSSQPMADVPPGDLEPKIKAYVDLVEDDPRVGKPIIEQIRDKTDGELQYILRCICNGWPEHLKSVAAQVSVYFREHGSLSKANRLLQTVIPKSITEDMLQKIYQATKALLSAYNVLEELCGGLASSAT